MNKLFLLTFTCAMVAFLPSCKNNKPTSKKHRNHKTEQMVDAMDATVEDMSVNNSKI
jgi:hypothetical protein